MGKTRAKASNFGGSFPAIVLVSGRYLATVRFCQQGRRSQSRSSDVDFGDKMDLVQAFRIQRRLGKHPIFKGLFLMFLSIPLLSPCRLANRGSLKISRLQVGTVFHLFHCPQLCRSSPPASAHWVCSAGAGSGKLRSRLSVWSNKNPPGNVPGVLFQSAYKNPLK